MVNRVEQYLNRQQEPVASPTDYWWVDTRESGYFVSARTARAIERRLERDPVPRWTVFRDLHGARHRILTHSVRMISESTAAQRAAWRAFRRALKDERSEDENPWEDGDRPW